MVKARDLPIVAHAHTLGEVLTGTTFRVPTFQRPYAWTEEEVEELWEDLTTEALSDTNRNSFHFFGTLLTAEGSDATALKNSRLELLDGQQRLATFTLLLIAIDRHLEQIEESEDATPRVQRTAAEHRTAVRDAIYTSSAKDARRVELRSEEDAVLNNILHGNSPGPSKLGDAFRVLLGAVKAFCESSENTVSDLGQLVSAVLERSMVIHARCIHGFDSFAVFSTLNARGLPLTAAQVLRARALGLVSGLGQTVEEPTRKAWDRIEHLKEEGDRFLQYYMIMRTGERIQAKSVVREFSKVFKEVREQKNATEAFADLAAHLDGLALLYSDIRQGVWPSNSPGVSAWRQHRLRLLVRELAVKQALPLIMATAYAVPEMLPEATDVIERAAFVALTCFPNQTKWGDFLFERANGVYEGTVDIKTLKSDIREFFIQQLGNPEKRLAENLPLNLRFNGRKKTLVRYFLTTINDFGFPSIGRPAGKPDESVVWNLGKIHLDHISAKALGDAISSDDKDRLGNLTPLYGPVNSSLGSQPFSAKRREYKDSALRMTRDLAEQELWNIAEILKREKAIGEFAAKLYCRDMTI